MGMLLRRKRLKREVPTPKKAEAKPAEKKPVRKKEK